MKALSKPIQSLVLSSLLVLAILFFLAVFHLSPYAESERALSYLVGQQLSDGNFPSLMCRDAAMKNCRSEQAVFPTTFVLHSLNAAENAGYGSTASGAAKKYAVSFLARSQEPNGLWRYWTVKDPFYNALSPDFDDTSSVAAELLGEGIDLSLADSQMLDTASQGLFPTWYGEKETFDCVVNANALYYLSLINRSSPLVCDYVNDAVLNRKFPTCSVYYENVYSFYYAVTRAYADGKAECLKPSVEFIARELSNESVSTSPLNASLSAVSMLNAGVCGEGVANRLAFLSSTQRSDGSWVAEPFYIGNGYYFGSSSVSTALALEAFSKQKTSC